MTDTQQSGGSAATMGSSTGQAIHGTARVVTAGAIYGNRQQVTLELSLDPANPNQQLLNGQTYEFTFGGAAPGT